MRRVPLNAAHAERTVPMERVTGIYPVMYRVVPAGRGAAGGGVPEVKKGFTSTQISIEND